MKKEPFLQVSKRRNKARWQERLLIRFIALILALIVCGAVIVARYSHQIHCSPRATHQHRDHHSSASRRSQNR